MIFFQGGKSEDTIILIYFLQHSIFSKYLIKFMLGSGAVVNS